MLRKWYLIQVEIKASVSLRQDYTTAGVYYCAFLENHPGDIKMSDKHSRWWPEWYKYTRDSISDNIVFGTSMLFRPFILPNSAEYIG